MPSPRLYLRVEASLSRHPKVHQLVEAFGLDDHTGPYLVVGFLLAWWGYAAEFGSGGHPADCPRRVLDDMAAPLRAASTVAVVPPIEDALKKVRLMDGRGHPWDWQDYTGLLLTKRAKDADRKRTVRGLSAPCPGDTAQHSTAQHNHSPAAPPPARDEVFERAWSEYPKREGDNPKRPALRAWRARIGDGEDPQEMLGATIAYRRRVRADGKDGTEYVMMARTFYGPDLRYRDYLVKPVEAKPPVPKPAPPPEPVPSPEERERDRKAADEAMATIRRLGSESARAAIRRGEAAPVGNILKGAA